MSQVEGRYVPEGATAIERPELKAVVYTWEAKNGIYAKGYSGRRKKPDFNYRFMKEEQRKEYLEKFFSGLEKSKERNAEYKEREKAQKAEFLEKLKPGTILYSSWGYDQTNIDYYEVTKVRGSTVWIRQIAQTQTEDSFMSGMTEPRPGEFLERAAEMKKIVRSSYLRIDSCANAYLWDGKPRRNSWYA